MQINPTPISGLFEIIPKVFFDNRGRFFEFFKDQDFDKIDPTIKFIQENLSFSQKGVLRGLHLQLPPFQQAKVVTVVQGKVLDVVVDLRKGSPTFGKSHQTVLDGEHHKMIYIPEGFAH
jgi:dTDP-4-dehydrorhamnose 3,5-epimerase